MYSGPHIKKDGLVFGYDTGQFSESNPNFDKFKPVKGRNRFYKGKSSVNYIAFHNPRIDSSYTSYTRGSGTWDSRHPNAITVYNKRGSNLSSYVNTGVGDWSNTDHAHWQFDRQLKKPVVVMHDRTGSWKAKSFGAAMGAWSNLGMSAGSQYTISWLQWVDKLNKYANAGFYSRTTSNTQGFHDGMTNGRATALNTKLRTWQRVYATFTVSSNRNLSDSNGNVYMYGHYATRGTVKIADVQLELNNHPTSYQEFDGSDTHKQSRSSTEGVLDLAKTANIDVSNVSFDSNGFLTFDGTDDYLLTPFTRGTLSDQLTMIAYYKFDGNTSRTYTPVFGGMELGTGTEFFIGKNSGNTHIGVQDGNYIGSFVQGSNAWDGNYHQIVYTYNNGTGKIYLDGVLKNTGTFSKCNAAEQITIGRESEGSGYWFIGDIPVVQIYNRVLPADEIQQNFRTYKNRFDI